MKKNATKNKLFVVKSGYTKNVGGTMSRFKKFLAAAMSISLFIGRPVFALPDGSPQNPFLINGQGVGYEEFLEKSGDASFSVFGSVYLQPEITGYRDFLTKGYVIHILEGGSVNLGKESFFKGGNRFSGRFVVHPNGTLLFRFGTSATKKIWYGTDDARVRIVRGTVTIDKWDRLSSGEVLFQLSEDAIYEVQQESYIGTWNLPGIADFGMTMNAPKGSAIRIKDGGKLILQEGKYTKGSTLNLDGSLTVESGGAFLASRGSLLNMTGNLTVGAGAIATFDNDAAININQDGEVAVASTGKIIFNPTARLNGSIRVRGEVFVRATDVELFSEGEFILSEGGTLYSASDRMGDFLKNAKPDGEEVMDGIPYYRWIYESKAPPVSGDNGGDSSGGAANDNSNENSGNAASENEKPNDTEPPGDSSGSGHSSAGSSNTGGQSDNGIPAMDGGANHSTRASVRPDPLKRGAEGALLAGEPRASRRVPSDRDMMLQSVFKIGDRAFLSRSGKDETGGFSEAAPALIYNKSMLPVRMLSESLMLSVDYDASDQTIGIYESGRKNQGIQLVLGDEKTPLKENGRNFIQKRSLLIVNERRMNGEAFVVIEDGRVLLPLREIQGIFSVLGFDTQVRWNHLTKEITVITKRASIE